VQDTGQAQEKAKEVAGQAKGRLKEQVDQRSTDAGRQITTTASDVRSVAEELRTQGKDTPARYADQAADRVERAGQWLENADGDQILRDVEDFARRNPWAVALGGLALGFAASRVLRASSTDRYRTGGMQYQQYRRSGSAGGLPSPGRTPYPPTTSSPDAPVATTPPVGGALGPERL
jgi:hypothetical protein